jgi:hypothetical protein
VRNVLEQQSKQLVEWDKRGSGRIECVLFGEKGVMWGKISKRCKVLNGRKTKISVKTVSVQHICVAALDRCSLWRS